MPVGNHTPGTLGNPGGLNFAQIEIDQRYGAGAFFKPRSEVAKAAHQIALNSTFQGDVIRPVRLDRQRPSDSRDQLCRSLEEFELQIHQLPVIDKKRSQTADSLWDVARTSAEIRSFLRGCEIPAAWSQETELLKEGLEVLDALLQKSSAHLRSNLRNYGVSKRPDLNFQRDYVTSVMTLCFLDAKDLVLDKMRLDIRPGCKQVIADVSSQFPGA